MSLLRAASRPEGSENSERKEAGELESARCRRTTPSRHAQVFAGAGPRMRFIWRITRKIENATIKKLRHVLMNTP